MLDHLRVRAQLWPLAIARVMLGVMFLVAGVDRLQAGPHWPDRMSGFLSRFDDRMVGFYQSFIDKVAVPHSTFFGYVVALGEVAVGIALVTGTCTRLASFFGLIMVVNFMLLNADAVWSPTNHDMLYFLLLLAFMVTGAGRSFGVDYYLSSRYRRPLLW